MIGSLADLLLVILYILVHFKVRWELTVSASAPFVTIPKAVVDEHGKGEHDHNLVAENAYSQRCIDNCVTKHLEWPLFKPLVPPITNVLHDGPESAQRREEEPKSKAVLKGRFFLHDSRYDRQDDQWAEKESNDIDK